MSQENVERVRRGLEAYIAGDWETLGEMYDPDVVMHHLRGWPEPGPSVGRDAALREFQHLREGQEIQAAEIKDVVDGGDRVAARYVWRGTWGGGPDTKGEFTFVFTFRNGKVVSQRHFWDHVEALKAAGLSE